MRFRKIAAALAATTAVALAAPAGSAAAGDYHKPKGERSLATVLAADGNRLDRNWRDFDILEKAVYAVLDAKPDSPVGVLADGSVPLTAFIPTDLAFKRLVWNLTGTWYGSERKALEVLAGLPVDTIEAVLLYHVVPGATITYRQALKADGAELTTALGSAITVDVRGRKCIKLIDADTDDRDPKVIRSLKNINKGNLQIAHGINRVLRPIDLP